MEGLEERGIEGWKGEWDRGLYGRVGGRNDDKLNELTPPISATRACSTSRALFSSAL